MRKSKKLQKQIIIELQALPNKSYVCQKLGISRQTLYRWVNDDIDFEVAIEDAIRVGTESINDLAEGKLVEKIKQGEFRAIKYHLDNKHKDYKRPRPDNWYHLDRKKPGDNKIVFVDFGNGEDPNDDVGFRVG
ncbi:MAG TPA: hypothetical protein PKA42_02290 [Candidatus Paceibacterota bacterium]|nr:hypothetical protein [Candidatus Paceibacterota bacterium]HMO82973.1 hypothetical protein [Candidatus Paceibacterota bacterium]